MSDMKFIKTLLEHVKIPCTYTGKPMRPRAEVFEGMPVIRKNLKPDGSYQELKHLETGKIVGLKEENYKLIEKNGEFIEETRNDVLKGEPFGIYRVVKGKDGKLKSLSENTSYPEGQIKLTEDVNGNIKTETISPWQGISHFSEDLAKDIDAINAVKRYNGHSEVTADELRCEALGALIKALK